MQVDYSIELGPDDPTLEFPWASDDGAVRYYDLKQHPEMVLNIEEARDHQELSEFLSRINAASSPLQTAKCDVWFTQEILPEEEIFGASCKFACYVDLLFTSGELQTSFEKHEALARDLYNLLQRAPEMAAAMEFTVRRCHYHAGSVDGFCITAYIYGYGDSEEEAAQRWAIALKLLQHALVQVTASLARSR
ncbi:MAG TPA: hypothetical protein VHA33_11085 [Candidatus Angelobacter sp.]|jgi:hypothetical protein|nr:hypothetical protein [Candidatus Angelobacter sp.]